MAYDIYFKRGTQSSYEGIEEPDPNILYFCTDTGNMYLGNTQYTGKISYNLPERGVYGTLYIDTTRNNIYTWNGITYIPAITPMMGANASMGGTGGLVPAPGAGKNTAFLRGDGTWAVPVNTTYNAAGEDLGLVKTGGDVTINDGIITVNDNSHNHTVSNVTGLQDTINKMTRLLSVTLTTTGWTGTAAPYSQTVSVAGMTVNDNPLLVSMLENDADTATQEAYNEAFALISSGTGITNNGSVTFKVYEKPKINITVGLKGY